jgi:hypothetical protein
MGALLSLLFSVDKAPHHLEGDCHCACDDASQSSGSQDGKLLQPGVTSVLPKQPG